MALGNYHIPHQTAMDVVEAAVDVDTDPSSCLVLQTGGHVGYKYFPMDFDGGIDLGLVLEVETGVGY